MPVNESLSWGFIVVDYQTFAAPHKMVLHCNQANAAGTWSVVGTDEASIPLTLKAYFDVLNNSLTPIDTTFGQWRLYKNETFPTPASFVGLGNVPTPNVAPAAQKGAGGQGTLTWLTATGRVVKAVMLDCDLGNPQKITYAAAQANTKAVFDYLTGHSNIKSIDGETLQTPYRMTIGWNKRLLREYGYVITP